MHIFKTVSSSASTLLLGNIEKPLEYNGSGQQVFTLSLFSAAVIDRPERRSCTSSTCDGGVRFGCMLTGVGALELLWFQDCYQLWSDVPIQMPFYLYDTVDCTTSHHFHIVVNILSESCSKLKLNKWLLLYSGLYWCDYKFRTGHAQAGGVTPVSSPSSQHQQKGVSPRMLKALVSRGHPEFSSNRQQDAHEFLLHLINLVEVSEEVCLSTRRRRRRRAWLIETHARVHAHTALMYLFQSG